MKKAIKSVRYKRARKRKTNYKTRLNLLKSRSSRIVIRLSEKNIWAQVINFEIKGDKVLATAHSRELVKIGWNYSRSNIPAAYLTGMLLAKKTKSNKVAGDLIIDIGMNKSIPGSKLYACLKGMVDSGLSVKHSSDVLPSDDRVSGKHISDYANKIKEDKQSYEKQFSNYLKAKILPEKISEKFEEVKKNIAK